MSGENKPSPQNQSYLEAKKSNISKQTETVIINGKKGQGKTMEKLQSLCRQEEYGFEL